MADVRLIDANALKGNREWFDCHACGDECEIDYVAWRDIENAPTIEAVPVVRCMECKWCELLPISAYCAMWNSITKRNGFCYKGVKMDGGAEG